MCKFAVISFITIARFLFLSFFLCLLTIATTFYAGRYTAVCVLSVLNIVLVLDLESVCLIPNIYTIIILHNVLLWTCSVSY